MSKNGTDIEHHLGWKEFDHHFPVAHRFLVSIYEINRRLWRCCGQHREIPVATSVSTKYNTGGATTIQFNNTSRHTHMERKNFIISSLFLYLIIIERKLKNLLLYSLLLLSRRKNMKWSFRCLTQQPLPAAQQLDLFFLFLFSFSCVLSYIII